MWLVVRDCVQHIVVSWMYRAINEQHVRAFSVSGSTVWNLLPDELRDETENTFRQSLKTLLFRQCVLSTLEVLRDNALYKSTFYLLACLLTYTT